jgi:putative DNA primase/helicase
MITLAGPELPIRVDELDQDQWILNCQNGLVDLTSGKNSPHDRNECITKLCRTEFDLNSEAPVWNKFLRDVFVDDELIQFVQRLFGYFLTGDVSEQKLSLFWGNGANGKSTLLNAFMDTIGPDYTMQCMPDFLMEKKGESHPTEKATLFGKRFVSCVETEASRKLAESMVKILTGGEKIMARRMREDFWEFDPTHKLVLCTNHRPIISGTDHGIWRRVLLVPFLQRFDGERRDKQLPEKLKAERPGILAWAVRGCLEWQRIGLNPPPCVCSATEDYRSSEDIFGRFVADCCVVNKSTAVKFAELYERFKKWADDGGEFLLSKRGVGAWLEENGFEKYSANGRWYRGMALRNTTQTEVVENNFTTFG